MEASSSGDAIPRSRGTNAAFLSTVQCGMSPPSCCTYPMERRSCTGFNVLTLRPPTHTSPESAEIIRLNRRSSVVLPAPLSPTSATISPRSRDRVTRSRTGAEPNRFTTSFAERAGPSVDEA
jgi:hypothetical protein